MKVAKLLAVFLIGITPALAFAALNAGVVNGVWFSNPNPEAGEQVRIFTAIQNQSSETITGNVSFLVNAEIIGSASFKVARNDVVSISVPYTFTDGTADVSAYITSVKGQNVAYTIVPETSVSVSRRQTEEDSAKDRSKNTNGATSTIAQTTVVVTDTVRDAIENIEPIAESVASKVDDFRDEFLEASAGSKQTENVSIPSLQISPDETTEEAGVFKNFLRVSKTIVSLEGLSIWKKVIGLLLSVASLLILFWFIPLTLIMLFIFWLLIRGRRIR